MDGRGETGLKLLRLHSMELIKRGTDGGKVADCPPTVNACFAVRLRETHRTAASEGSNVTDCRL